MGPQETPRCAFTGVLYISQMFCLLRHWGREKWMPICKWHFQMHFLEWKCLNSDWNFTEVCSHGPIDNIPALVQLMAWQHPFVKPLSEPMMVSLPTHICLTRPQWANKTVLRLTQPVFTICIYCILNHTCCVPQFCMGSNKDFLNLNWIWKRLRNWEINYVRTSFHEIWV